MVTQVPHRRFASNFTEQCHQRHYNSHFSPVYEGVGHGVLFYKSPGSFTSLMGKVILRLCIVKRVSLPETCTPSVALAFCTKASKNVSTLLRVSVVMPEDEFTPASKLMYSLTLRGVFWTGNPGAICTILGSGGGLWKKNKI